VVADGTVMKEYVAVPGSLLKKTMELQKYFALSFDYVRGPQAQTHEEGQDRQKAAPGSVLDGTGRAGERMRIRWSRIT